MMTPADKRKIAFFRSEEGQAIRQKLQSMAGSSSYITASSYSANNILYPDNQISFVEKHLTYLFNHPKIDVDMYIANIRLMVRVR